MIFFLLTMFNLLLQKTKKIIESRGSENETSCNTTDKPNRNENPVSFSESDNVQLKEFVYGSYFGIHIFSSLLVNEPQ